MMNCPSLRRMLSLAAALSLCAALGFWSQPAALAHGSHASVHAVKPAVGDLTIRPKVVHIGQILTISGVTHGFVQFLPPFVVINSVQQHTVPTRVGMCGGAGSQPVAVYSKTGGGSGGPGTRQNPPTGTAWKITIRIPARMFSSTSTGKSVKIPTPPGRYEVAAIGVGLDYCTLPKKSNFAFSVGYFQIVR